MNKNAQSSTTATASRTANKDAAQSKKPPTGRELIERRAFEIYQSRVSNGHRGDHVSDWLEAEREVNGKTQTAPRSARA